MVMQRAYKKPTFLTFTLLISCRWFFSSCENIPLKWHRGRNVTTQTIIIDEWHFSTIRATRGKKIIVKIVSTSNSSSNNNNYNIYNNIKSVAGGGGCVVNDCCRRIRLPQTNLSSFRLFWLRDILPKWLVRFRVSLFWYRFACVCILYCIYIYLPIFYFIKFSS